MKYINRTIAFALAILSILSCAIRVDVDEEGLCTCTYRMRFDCSIDNESFVMTKAGYQWEDGARVQMQFQNKSSRIKGLATYSSATGEWTVTTDKTMSVVTDASCEAYWMKGLEGDQIADALTLGPEIASFKDISATYTLDSDGYLQVTAHLYPMTSRLRFIGEPGRSFTVSGLQYISAYSRTSNSFTRVSQDVTVTIGQEGSSDYIYAVFAKSSERKLTISGEHNTAYVRTFPSEVLVVGSSGYMTVPTPAEPGNWSFINTKNQQEVVLPTLDDVNVTGIKGTSVGFASSVTDLGNSVLLASGFVYGKNPSLTVETALTYSCINPSESFSVRIGGLEKLTTYYVRAFAINPKGIAYGPEESFTTTDQEDGITAGDFEEGEENWNDKWGDNSDIVDGDSVWKDEWNDDQNWNENWGGDNLIGGEDISKDEWNGDQDWNENWGGDNTSDGEDISKDGYSADEDWNEEITE